MDIIRYTHKLYTFYYKQDKTNWMLGIHMTVAEVMCLQIAVDLEESFVPENEVQPFLLLLVLQVKNKSH